ncbi:hypothetical protein HKD42_01495 [Altererythrobacter sp. RZ02]|uniref:Uncharacterized protein n=1 Tax=Pontixanthobacter rizhaonensis TaxID=2730337 RepID=A0A848QB52_9SPHN|nr:hypothetical protein [Pontixanthobacter rizhaonensis]NMW30731.1 hypothetical protein [Pontixanthobacter rizhaonensis]
MLSLITANPIPFIIALIIGLATAWWIWGRTPDVEADYDADSDADHETNYTAPAAAAAATGAAAAATTSAAEPAPPKDLKPEPAVPVKPLAVAELDTEPKPKAKPKAKATPKAASKPKPKIAAAVGKPDDLTRIKGIGPQLNDLCLSLGVSRFDQIAKWKKADIAEVDQYLKMKGRIDRDDWVGQAKILAAGGTVSEGKPKIAAAVGKPDDLKKVKGIGPKLEKLCNSLGVKRWDQIAAWKAADVKEVDGYLGSFKGRIQRDEWVKQAKLLAKGDFDGHVKQYGK